MSPQVSVRITLDMDLSERDLLGLARGTHALRIDEVIRTLPDGTREPVSWVHAVKTRRS